MGCRDIHGLESPSNIHGLESPSNIHALESPSTSMGGEPVLLKMPKKGGARREKVPEVDTQHLADRLVTQVKNV